MQEMLATTIEQNEPRSNVPGMSCRECWGGQILLTSLSKAAHLLMQSCILYVANIPNPASAHDSCRSVKNHTLSSTISGFNSWPDTVTRATVTGRLNRRGP